MIRSLFTISALSISSFAFAQSQQPAAATPPYPIQRGIVVSLEPLSAGGVMALSADVRLLDQHYGLGIYTGVGYNHRMYTMSPGNTFGLKNPIQLSYLFGMRQDQLDVRIGITNEIKLFNRVHESMSHIYYHYLTPSAYVGYRHHNRKNDIIFTLGLSYEYMENYLYPNFGIGYRIQ